MSETFKQHKMSFEQIGASTFIRDAAEALETMILEECPNSREKSLAITKLEECVMWANKSIALHGTNYDG